MKVARYPAMRREVMTSVAALSDPSYQRRVWIERTYPHPGFFDDFRTTLNILEDCVDLDDPSKALGAVLVSPEEVERFAILGSLLEMVLADTQHLPDDAVVEHQAWLEVVAAAGLCLASMTVAWGFADDAR